MTDYTTMFAAHDKSRGRRLHNAGLIADVLARYHQPRTVIDLGCGMGFFLSVMADRGAEVTAVDGDWVTPLETEVPKDRYVIHDLESPFAAAARYDLAVSFEVAEHLSAERGEGFVAELCALSDWVLFSAAIPGQRGQGHVNCRWQSYWADLFAGHGYRCFDPIRRRIASDPDVFNWFAQNTLVFVKEGVEIPETLAEHQIAPSAASYVIEPYHTNFLKREKKKMRALKRELSST